MDVFMLLFIVSFLALIFTLAVIHIRKRTKTKGNVAKGSKRIGWVSDVLGRCTESTELRDDGTLFFVEEYSTLFEVQLVIEDITGKSVDLYDALICLVNTK